MNFKLFLCFIFCSADFDFNKSHKYSIEYDCIQQVLSALKDRFAVKIKKFECLKIDEIVEETFSTGLVYVQFCGMRFVHNYEEILEIKSEVFQEIREQLISLITNIVHSEDFCENLREKVYKEIKNLGLSMLICLKYFEIISSAQEHIGVHRELSPFLKAYGFGKYADIYNLFKFERSPSLRSLIWTRINEFTKDFNLTDDSVDDLLQPFREIN